MRPLATPAFWAAYRDLPDEVRDVADKNFGLMKENPRRPSPRLKKVGAFWSARVGRGYRAVAPTPRSRSTSRTAASRSPSVL